MRAMLCDSFGDIANLRLADVAPPAISSDHDVLIQVAAAGVNFADTLMIGGTYQDKPPLPFTPGLEMSGMVRSCGAAVRRVKPGDRVMAVVGRGAFAAQALALDTDVFPIPAEMDFITAAGFPIAYGTSHGALRWRAELQPGEVLLVHGAAGGVGLTAVEIGRALGARVIAAASSAEKLQLCTDHGADDLVNYRDTDLRTAITEITGGAGVDVAMEAVGIPGTFDLCTRIVRAGGTVANIGVHGAPTTLHLEDLWIKNITITMGLVSGSTVPTLLKLARDGRIEAEKLGTHHFKLDDIQEAYDVFAAAGEHDALKVVIQA